MNRHRADHGRHPGTPAELLTPYRLLAWRVIALAVRDLIPHGQSTSERDSARSFFSGSPMLTHWCELADLDPAAIRAQVLGLLDRTRPGIAQARRH